MGRSRALVVPPGEAAGGSSGDATGGSLDGQGARVVRVVPPAAGGGLRRVAVAVARR